MLKEKINQLDEYIRKLESADTDLEDAIGIHQQANALIKELDEGFLKAKAALPKENV